MTKRKAQTDQPAPCKHPPARVWAWYAYNCYTGKRDILCAACCDCGAVLAGEAQLQSEEDK